MAWFKREKKPVIDDRMSVMDLLHAARTAKDPNYTHACLKRAEVLAPESLEVQKALLLFGRLRERGRRVPDFSVIKSWLLHPYEHPEDHDEEEQRRMARELFEEKRLQQCLKMADNPQDFLQSYLNALCDEYMRIFIAGESSHAPRVFGISHKASLHKYLAKPVNDMIRNIYLSPFLTEDEQRLLAPCVYKAFYRFVSGEVKELDSLLGAQLRAQLGDDG